jgi:hypothetical protein
MSGRDGVHHYSTCARGTVTAPSDVDPDIAPLPPLPNTYTGYDYDLDRALSFSLDFRDLILVWTTLCMVSVALQL